MLQLQVQDCEHREVQMRLCQDPVSLERQLEDKVPRHQKQVQIMSPEKNGHIFNLVHELFFSGLSNKMFPKKTMCLFEVCTFLFL